MARAIDIKVTLDLPDGVGTERVGDGHGIEVKFPLPDVCQCEARGRKDRATYEDKTTVYMACRLDRCGQPCFLGFQPCVHRCSRRGHRPEHLAPFKRKHVTYTDDVEQYVVRLLIGGNEEDVARRLGVSAETVKRIIENRLRDAQDIDPERTIKPIGLDEISLKQRNKPYVTVMTDLTDPNTPKVPAVPRGKDTAAARHCLGKLSLDFGKFWTTTYDNWKTGILNDFDDRYTSAAEIPYNRTRMFDTRLDIARRCASDGKITAERNKDVENVEEPKIFRLLGQLHVLPQINVCNTP